MFQILGIALGITIIAILIVVLASDAKAKKPYDLSSFLKWISEVHAGENTDTQIINNKATSESKSVKITFDFKTDRGTLHDKALDKKYKVARVDGKYITLDD